MAPRVQNKVVLISAALPHVPQLGHSRQARAREGPQAVEEESVHADAPEQAEEVGRDGYRGDVPQRGGNQQLPGQHESKDEGMAGSDAGCIQVPFAADEQAQMQGDT